MSKVVRFSQAAGVLHGRTSGISVGFECNLLSMVWESGVEVFWSSSASEMVVESGESSSNGGSGVGCGVGVGGVGCVVGGRDGVDCLGVGTW